MRILLCSLALLVTACATLPRPARPTLIVQVTCDQLRGDLLERFAPALQGGFARVRSTGMVFTNATIEHAPSNSYPGHVTLATGVQPRKHGIIDNSWLDTSGQPRFTGGVDDAESPITGQPSLQGVSPKYLQVTGLADWVLANDPKARFVAVSTGQYASLLQSGKARGDTYWFSPDAKRYVTSTYYRSGYPDWVEEFHRTMLPRYLAEKRWELSVPDKHRALADGPITFPHVFEGESVMIDEATLSLASMAVKRLQLGGRGATDYLSIVLSATDYNGHHYGPTSIEQLDTIVRIDRALEQFFRQLDAEVGRDRWIVAITADHGGADVPEVTGKGIRVTETMVADVLRRASDAASAGPRESAADRVIPIVSREPYVGSVMRVSDLASDAPSSDEFVRFYRNSYFPKRIPVYPLVADNVRPLCAYGLVVRLAYNAVPYFAPSVHGTPYDYDRRVTMMFAGPGIRAGRDAGAVHNVDVAPTLASLAGIAAPVTVDGRVIVRTVNEAKQP